MQEKKVDFKVLLVGKEGVGKSSIINRFVYDTFTKHPTLEFVSISNFHQKKVTINDSNVSLSICEEPKLSRGRDWLLDGDIRTHVSSLILVYDSSDRSSFEFIKKRLKLLNSSSKIAFNAVITIVKTKSDLNGQIQVSDAEVLEFSKEENACFVETNSKNNINIDILFELIGTQCLVNYYKNSEEQYKIDHFLLPSEKDLIQYIHKKTSFFESVVSTKDVKSETLTEKFVLKQKMQTLESELNYLNNLVQYFIDDAWVASSDLKNCKTTINNLLKKLKTSLQMFEHIKAPPFLDKTPSARSTTPPEEKISTKETSVQNTIVTLTKKESDKKPEEQVLQTEPSSSQTISHTQIYSSHPTGSFFNQSNSTIIPQISRPNNPFKDPISGDKINESVNLSSGYTFDKSSLLKWYAQNPEAQQQHICPITHEKIIWDGDKPLMFPNKSLDIAYDLISSQQKISQPSSS